MHYEPKALICTASGGCEKVQESEYAVIAGVPVAVLGLVFWVLVAGLVLRDTDTARIVVAALGIAGLAFSAYLVALQLFVIDAICIWCIVNDLALVPLLAVAALVRVRTPTRAAG